MSAASAWPLELRYRKLDRTLNIKFDSGEAFALSAEYLRVESPSAEVQGHGQNTRTLVTGKQAVGIQEMRPVGNYAVRIVFDDGHDTGLFSWDYLLQLGREHTKRWIDYETRLKTAGKNRTEA